VSGPFQSVQVGGMVVGVIVVEDVTSR
jgi:hypothetical protein